MKKLFMFLLLGVLLISFASAITWDNVAYWNLDESSGTILDSTANNIDSTSEWNITYGQTGKIGNSIKSNSLNSGAEFAPTTDLVFTDYSFNAWVKVPNTAPSISIFYEKRTQTSDSGTMWIYATANVSGKAKFNIDHYGQGTGSRAGNQKMSNVTFNTDEWVMVTGTYDDSTKKINFYINGTWANEETMTDKLNQTNNHAEYLFYYTRTGAYIDEVGFWNRSLSQSEITELYNSGAGTPFGAVINLTLTLQSPTNGTTIADIGTNFTVSGSNLTTVAGTWTNVTYYVWRNSTTLINQTTLSLSGETFNQIQFIDDFTRDNYEWNAEACYNNVTGDYCLTALTNSSFTVALYTLVSENYVNETVSGTLETFNLSIDLFPGIDLTDARFIYEGEYVVPSIVAEDNNRFVLVTDFQIPIVDADVNNSFFWELEFNNNETVNTTSNVQLVRKLLLDNCAVYTNTIFNISLFDERDKTSLTGDIELIYQLLNENFQVIKTFNFSATSVSNTLVCSGINLSEKALFYSSEIRYVSTGYAPELYHIQRAEVGTDTQNIRLYDLNSSSATQFKITYQDSYFNFVEGAIIQLQRKYISEGIYEVVEAPLTSSDGVALVSVDLNSIKYRATVVKNGVVLDEFDNLVFKCQSELTGECDYKLLGKIDPKNDLNLDNVRDFYYSEPILSNGTITVSFSIPSGIPAVIKLVLEQKDPWGNKILCNKTIISSAGSISCTYSESLGDSYIDLYLYKNGNPIARKTYILNPDRNLDWLGNNYIFIVILLFSLVGMALSSPEWIIINGIITLVISGALFLANGLDFVMGLGNIVWLVIAAVILISKMSKQEDR